jgi:hypothetical protein
LARETLFRVEDRTPNGDGSQPYDWLNRRSQPGFAYLVSVAEAGFVILSVAKDLNMAQILRFAQNDMGWLPLFRNRDYFCSVNIGLT